MERIVSKEACRLREKMGFRFFRTMAVTYCLNRHFVHFEFCYTRFNIFNWLYSCAGGNVDLYETESLPNMCYRRWMSFSFLKVKWRKKRKVHQPREKEGLKLRAGNIQMMIDAFRSFRIRKLHLDLDTEDFVLNAWLVPAFTLINSDQIQLKVNFEGISSLVLDLRTRLGSLLWIFIKNKYKSVFNL